MTSPSRRTLLERVAAAAGAAALAGCLDATGSPTPVDTDTGTDGPRTDDTPTGGDTVTGGGTDTATREQAPTAPASVDTDWPMPAADAGRSSYAPAVAGPTEPVAELWRTSLESAASAPVVADGTVYVGGADGTVVALDATDGSESWRATVGAPAAAPRALGDTVYVPTDGSLVALGAAEGDERFRIGATGEDVLVAGHGLYTVAGAAVTAYDLADGAERWRTAVEEPWEPHLFASPDELLLSSGVKGPAPWRLAPDTGEVRGKAPEPGHDFPAERFYRDGAYYGLDPFFENVHATALDGGTGWSQGLPAQEIAAIAGGGDRVYFVGASADDSGLYALDDADGAVAWSTDAVVGFEGRPVVAGDCVLVRGGDALHGFDPADGSQLWTLPGGVVGTRVAVADDMVFTTDGGAVAAFRPPD